MGPVTSSGSTLSGCAIQCQNRKGRLGIVSKNGSCAITAGSFSTVTRPAPMVANNNHIVYKGQDPLGEVDRSDVNPAMGTSFARIQLYKSPNPRECLRLRNGKRVVGILQTTGDNDNIMRLTDLCRGDICINGVKGFGYMASRRTAQYTTEVGELFSQVVSVQIQDGHSGPQSDDRGCLVTVYKKRDQSEERRYHFLLGIYVGRVHVRDGYYRYLVCRYPENDMYGLFN